MIWALCIVGAYLMGSIPFGVIIGRTRGVDIREHGSGNIGASNVGRVLGRRLGLLCFALDVAKGAAPVVIAGLANDVIDRPANNLTHPELLSQSDIWLWLVVALAAVLGHMFSIFLGFKGGKGVATGFGAMVAMWPLLTIPALGALVVWYGTLRLTKYVAVASMIAALSLPAGYVLAMLPSDGRNWVASLLHAAPPFIVTCVLALLVIVRHRDNIMRLRKGEEPQVGGSGRRGDVLDH